MGEPHLASQKAGGDADECTGEYIADEVPVTNDQQQCRDEQQCGEWPDTASIKSHENTGECAGENHVAGGKAAFRGAGQEVEDMLGPLQNGRRIRYPEKQFQRGVIDRIGADGGQACKRGRLTKRR